MITLISGNRLLKLDILRTEVVVFLLQTLRCILESDVTFDLALLIELDACLKLRKLRLLAFSESALRGSSGYTKLTRHASKVPTTILIPVLDAPTVGIRHLNPNCLNITEN